MSLDICKESLKSRLTPIQWYVTQEKGTERPFTGRYNKFYASGIYTCIVCDQELFSSKTKYDSECGWPAFNEVLDQGRIKLIQDTTSVIKIPFEIQFPYITHEIIAVFCDVLLARKDFNTTHKLRVETR